MEVVWKQQILKISYREKKISKFINNPEFEKWLEEDNSILKFPLYDKVGWIYTTDMEHKESFDEKFLINRKQFKFWEILFYKDAKVYYPEMIII